MRTLKTELCNLGVQILLAVLFLKACNNFLSKAYYNDLDLLKMIFMFLDFDF